MLGLEISLDAWFTHKHVVFVFIIDLFELVGGNGELPEYRN